MTIPGPSEYTGWNVYLDVVALALVGQFVIGTWHEAGIRAGRWRRKPNGSRMPGDDVVGAIVIAVAWPVALVGLILWGGLFTGYMRLLGQVHGQAVQKKREQERRDVEAAKRELQKQRQLQQAPALLADQLRQRLLELDPADRYTDVHRQSIELTLTNLQNLMSDVGTPVQPATGALEARESTRSYTISNRKGPR